MTAANRDMELRAKPEMVAMVNAAKEWMDKNPDDEPDFSRMGALIFNGNSAADEIEHVITEAGEKAGAFVEPEDIWNAVTYAFIETGRV